MLILALLVLFALWTLFKAIGSLREAAASAEERGPALAKGFSLLLLFGLLTYPATLGPLVAQVVCSVGTCLEVERTVDLRDNGYVVEWDQRDQWDLRLGAPDYAHQAFDDLLAGRIAFFETSSLIKSQRHRMHFEDRTSRDCIQADRFVRDGRLPEGKCLAATPVTELQSRYRIVTKPLAYEKRRSQSIEIRERASGERIARFKVRRVPFASLNFDAGLDHYCPRLPRRDDDWPLAQLTTLVFRDRAGKVQTTASLAALEGERKSSPSRPASTPPAEPPTAQPSSPSASSCTLPELPATLERHRFSSYRGQRTTGLQIDNSGSLAMETDVYVNRPGVPVLLDLEARDPVIWRVRQSAGSQIFAVMAKGGSSTAVTGVRAEVPLLIWSSRYGVMVNCTGSEWERVWRQVAQLPMTSKVDGEKGYGSSREVIPFEVGERLSARAYEESGDIDESRYVFSSGLAAGPQPVR